ncbi:multicopper oxidase [Amanita thiersii Skay4041]|uniref:Multicopper oxidase n=1 Tax=Amanita thiersii Skay4041 TaxID=703135 RepID=A0A2A9NIK4_9AGAR|nr:multicopper oxidase [Amanita thiersii Skay4041]
MLGFLLAPFALVAPVLCATRNYELTLTNEFISPNGINRSAVLANKQLPGPLITAHKNDELRVKVINRLTDKTMAQGTSIHWHGLLQHRSATQDGAAWVTQCPIAAGDDFLYHFNVEQTGTYWYHSHITTQYCDGLRGPIVVYDENDPLRHLYDVDDENTVITLGDWLDIPSPQAFVTLVNPETTLINGRGRHPNSNSSPPPPLSIINVKPNTRYRFRLVNVACVAGFDFSIDGHKMNVIETDGTETIPSRAVDGITIWAGQRVSVIVKTDQKVDNYWIRAKPIIVPSNPSNETGVNAAILRYQGASNADPTTSQSGSNFAHEEDLIPLKPSFDIAGKPDVKLNFNIGLNADATAFAMNGHTFTPPTVPVLLQILSGKADPLDLMPKDSVIVLPRNKLIEITIPGGSIQAPHPFHLHGHKFAVVRSAGSTRVNTLLPPFRDVVNTGAELSDNVTIRFRTDNPGPWIMHCHVDFHLEAGLAVVFAEDPKGQVHGNESVEVDKAWKDLCPKWDSTKEGKQFSISDLF